MDEEEPAWRAELREKIMEDLARVYGHRWIHATEARREILRQAFASKVDAIMPHVLAAEERGRRRALTEAADLLRRPWKVGQFSSEQRAAIYEAADLIDPAKPEQP